MEIYWHTYCPGIVYSKNMDQQLKTYSVDLLVLCRCIYRTIGHVEFYLGIMLTIGLQKDPTFIFQQTDTDWTFARIILININCTTCGLFPLTCLGNVCHGISDEIWIFCHWSTIFSVNAKVKDVCCMSIYNEINLGKLIEMIQCVFASVHQLFMMTSSNGNIFRVTGHLCGEFIGDRWIPSTKASKAELWCFLYSVPEWTVK